MDPIETAHGVLDASARPLIMGILNVTPDSFSDGGEFFDPDVAVEQAARMTAEGADLIDIGAESSRPGSQPVPDDEQIRRLVPVIERIRASETRIPISVDTRRAAVADAAIDAGADLVNDISALRDDPALARLVARRGVGVVLMHMQGTPTTMQDRPAYDDVVAEILAFLSERIEAAAEVGIDPRRIIIDPGIGFGKKSVHNMTLLRRLDAFRPLGRPILVGPSRKMFIGGVTAKASPTDRLMGTAATVAAAVLAGANIVRVHDVAEMRQVVEMAYAIAHADAGGATRA